MPFSGLPEVECAVSEQCKYVLSFLPLPFGNGCQWAAFGSGRSKLLPTGFLREQPLSGRLLLFKREGERAQHAASR